MELRDRYAEAGFWLLISYATVATLALTYLVHYETVVRQSPPVIECVAPSSQTPK